MASSRGSKMKHIVALIAVLIATGPAHAQRDTTLWRDVGGGWSIRIDRTLNFGCYLLWAGERGTLVRFGFNRSVGNAYVIVGNMQWKSLQAGRQYRLMMQFDDHSPWTVSARGLTMGTTVFLSADLTDVRFFREFSRSHSFDIYYQDRRIAQISLRGSAAAVNEMITCQQQVEQVRPRSPGTPADPFAQQSPRAPSQLRSTSSDDPFAGGI